MKTEAEIRAALLQLSEAMDGAKSAGDFQAGQCIFAMCGVLSWALGEDNYGFGLVLKGMEDVDKSEDRARNN